MPHSVDELSLIHDIKYISYMHRGMAYLSLVSVP